MVDLNKKYSFGVWNFDMRADRFMTDGYRQEKETVLEMIEEAGRVEGLDGLEFQYPNYVNEDNIDEIKEALERNNLEVSLILPNFHGESIWQHGTFASRDDKVRNKAIERMKKAMDISAELGANLINFWPGQDGYDYSFQSDYIEEWDRLINAVGECAEYSSDVKLALEYKIKEPRTHSFIGTMGKSMLIVDQLNMDNVGVTIDVGHALGAYENVAESSVLLQHYGDKLFHFHLNDNYRYWDDDMIVGTVHSIEYLELFYWLERIGYDGWYSLDIYPYREDAHKAVDASFNAIKAMLKKLDEIGMDRITDAIKAGDTIETLELIREGIFPLRGE